ncbi:histidine phosphatase family protein [Robertmurraya yapensis]|uniref:Histidine phosphatase family protein n=1 Tax=Bacillus yapensis TaxID=2492960 RepID=A0A3S0RQK4_9BACI|nr:histidine phosphatase family protein [Bacillus yapensis]RTR34005.1 histidine phosphatase family protein [Bacillus yapensis]TKS97323.1 histidine phosphatase family protein [Bacillus yapensis]
MTRICLVRHGETDWNALGMLQGKTDIPLNHKGINQAKECGEFLKSATWDVVVTSPLTRAKQTAEIVSSFIDKPLIEMAEFIERDYGDAEGMTVEERMTTYPNKNYPNQEDRLSLTKRIMKGLEQIRQKWEGKSVIVVAHGAVINAILGELSNGEIGSDKTRLRNACLNNIEHVDDVWNIKDFNLVAHLTKL